MSRFIDINRLLEEISTSDRSAGDPWTLSRAPKGIVRKDSFNPSVVADLGAPVETLSSEIQASQKIEQANAVAANSASSVPNQTSTGSGFLSGLLGAFPLASGIAKLFGSSEKTSPPTLTPYKLPPSISFEGAVSSATSGITSLSYGSNGLPRASQNVAASGGQGSATTGKSQTIPGGSSYAGVESSELHRELSSLAGANAATAEAESRYSAGSSSRDSEASSTDGGQAANFGVSSESTARYPARGGSTPMVSQSVNSIGYQSVSDFSLGDGYVAPGSDSHTELAAQLGLLTASSFTPEQPGSNSVLSADLVSGSSAPKSSKNSADAFSSGSKGQPGMTASPSASGNNSQGQSILVQVQAMDSQSFMDHSQDIAQAVRQAMLNLNSLNDVILDL